MKDLALRTQDNPSDCDFIVDEIEHTFDRLGNCFDTMEDERKTKMNVIGSIFSFGFSLTKLTLNVAGCAIKNAPKAVVAVAALKREMIDAGTQEWNEYQKELKEDALNEKIKQLKYK